MARPGNEQYGGERGCGTDHFLVDLFDGIMRFLEAGCTSAIVSALDYSKAFNRMWHDKCLEQLANAGLSGNLL
jgi:hypothetical protein